jgi:hypothetical protein
MANTSNQLIILCKNTTIEAYGSAVKMWEYFCSELRILEQYQPKPASQKINLIVEPLNYIVQGHLLKPEAYSHTQTYKLIYRFMSTKWYQYPLVLTQNIFILVKGFIGFWHFHPELLTVSDIFYILLIFFEYV